jgi:predicted unusual protein kinase regulating ubiquinone biosynthesis (AarF/ABC1/UbiB family)
MADDNKPKVGAGRFLKLAGLTASVASDYARGRIKRAFQSEERAAEDHQENMARVGARIAETLGELKGAAMKVGQMASMAADLLPKEIAGALQALQGDAPPVDFAVIEAQIEAEFDQPLGRLFDDFDPAPFAAASIGQVHRARVDGRDVIVKVQYPGVDGAVDSDMRHLRLALLASGVLRVDRRALDASFAEISRRMHEELDYCNESDNVRAFYAFHQRHPFVRVPEVIGHRSAKRVLTLAYEPGDNLRDLARLGYTQEERNRCGENLWRALDAQIFELGTVHADPNPANFAYRRDGTVVMYDFGCVKQLAPGVTAGYESLVVDGLGERYPAIESTLRKLGLRKADGPVVPESFYKLWRDWLALPVLAEDPFDFGKARFEKEMVASLVPATLKHMESFQPSSELVFFNRTLAGQYATLRAMGARLPLGALLRGRFPGAEPWFPATIAPV